MEELQRQYSALQEQLQQLQQQHQQQQQQQQQQPIATPAPTVEVNRVSVKLPPFWNHKPTLWFAQAEAQFEIANITSETTKFAYVVAQLDERFAQEVEDILTNTPEQSPYTTLKTELIRRLSLSEEQRIKQLLMEEELGDRTPSQFLRHLRSLAGSGPVNNDLLRIIWRQRLPTHVQAILHTQPGTTSLDSLATLADRVIEVQPATAPVVNATTTSSSSSHLEQLSTKLQELSHQLETLQTELRNNKYKSFRSYSRANSHNTRSRSPSPTFKTNHKPCWYHENFANKAKKCTPPCSFFPTNSTGNH